MGKRMTRTIESAMGLVALFSLAGCYNTLNVTNGGLVCGPDDACPDGFVCLQDAPAGKHCFRKGTGPDAAVSTVTCPAPFGPFSTCSPEVAIGASTCDPVCQSHCPCDRRCVVNSSTYASFECEGTAVPPSTFIPVQGTCSGTNSVNCTPGSVCIADDVCPWSCFKTCRKDVDCPTNSRCSAMTLLDKTSQPVDNVFLCTPPTEVCNPTGAAGCATARSNFNCVFLAGLTGVANTDATLCDCKTLHYQAVGTSCTKLPDNCQAGAVCVDGICRQVCDRRASGSACPSGGCTAIYGSDAYGYCR